jgi:hypothetical protein
MCPVGHGVGAPVPAHLMKEPEPAAWIQGKWKLTAVRNSKNVDLPPWREWAFDFRGDTLTTDDPAQTQYSVCKFRFDGKRLATSEGRCMDRSTGTFVCDNDSGVYFYAIRDGKLLLGLSALSTRAKEVACDPLKPGAMCFVLVFTRMEDRRGHSRH